MAGALLLAWVAAAVAAALVLPGTQRGRGLSFEVELASAGALQAGARIRLAGREIGEVKALVPAGAGSTHVVAKCFVARWAAEHVRVNSELFVATPSVLGEAALEVGTTRGEPQRALHDGERVRGTDPPDVGQLVARVYTSTAAILLLLRAQRPAALELSEALRGLDATLAAMPEGADLAHLRRIGVQLDAAASAAKAVGERLAETRVTARIGALAHDATSAADRAQPQIDRLTVSIARVRAQVDALAGLVPDSRRAAATSALATLASADARADEIAAGLRALAAAVDSGQGAIGKFMADRELFDDLHETQRILKHQPWTLFFKPRKGQKTLAR